MSSGHSELHPVILMQHHSKMHCLPKKNTRKDWPSCLCLLRDAHCRWLQLDIVAYRPLVAFKESYGSHWYYGDIFAYQEGVGRSMSQELPFVRLGGVKPLGFSNMWRPNSRCPWVSWAKWKDLEMELKWSHLMSVISVYQILYDLQRLEGVYLSIFICFYNHMTPTLATIVVNVSDVYLCAGSLQQVFTFLQRLQ